MTVRISDCVLNRLPPRLLRSRPGQKNRRKPRCRTIQCLKGRPTRLSKTELFLFWVVAAALEQILSVRSRAKAHMWRLSGGTPLLQTSSATA